MILRIFLFWLPMVVLAFANAMLRELVLVKNYNQLHAQQLSTITLIHICSVYIWLIYPQLVIENAKQAFLSGILWLLLTVAFEFSLGRLTNKSWSFLLQDYNLLAGRIWVLFLLCLLLAPYLCYLIRNDN